MDLAREIGGPPAVERRPQLRELRLSFFARVLSDSPAKRANIFDPARVVLRLMFELEQPHLHIGVFPVELFRLLCDLALSSSILESSCQRNEPRRRFQGSPIS